VILEKDCDTNYQNLIALQLLTGSELNGI